MVVGVIVEQCKACVSLCCAKHIFSRYEVSVMPKKIRRNGPQGN